MTDMSRNYKREFDVLSPADRSLTPTGFYVSWYWSEGYETSERLKQLLQVLGAIVHELPADKTAAVPARPLALLVTSLVTDHAAAVLKDPLDHSESVFQQRLCTGAGGHCLDEFKDASAWLVRRGNDGRFRSPHRAGRRRRSGRIVQLQHGINRRRRQCADAAGRAGARVDETIGTSGDSAHRCRVAARSLRRAARDRHQLRAHPPALWKNAEQRKTWFAEERARTTNGQGFVDLKNFPDLLAQQVVDALADHGEATAIPFTSVAFPYSGYYVLRDGWRWDSRYLWLMAARRGSGHATENINSIALAAFGRHLLVDSGPESYGNPDFLPEDQRPYEKAIDQYADASVSHNTVIVDGQSQRRLIYGENFPDRRPYKKPINARWLHTDDFDFVEGKYDDGYGNDVATDIRAVHLRQIIFVRPADCGSCSIE